MVDRLDALLVVLKECKGRTCTHPWEVLGGGDSLASALDSKFDAYYEARPKVGFQSCELGYLREAEQNVEANGGSDVSEEGNGESGLGYEGLQGQKTFKYGGRWHDWV